MPTALAPLTDVVSARDVPALVALLRDAVEGGASVGFLLPVSDRELTAYWQEVLAEQAAGHRLILVARDGECIIGSVQLGLVTKANARHRAEVQKLLVLRTARGRGLGGALMHAVESAARQAGRSLLVLDTSASGNALRLYARCGYTRVGVIPNYARDPEGPLIDTVIYYKELSPA